LTGGNQQRNRWPSIPYNREETKAIHRARHLDIGEHHRYVGTFFQKGNGFIGIGRFDRLEAHVANHVGGVHTNQLVILDNQYHSLFSRISGHYCSGANGM